MINNYKKSYYLDDLDIKPGDIVVCKTSLCLPFWTAGQAYIVQKDGGLIDDNGIYIQYPGARFYK